jgi:hypothetical protein
MVKRNNVWGEYVEQIRHFNNKQLDSSISLIEEGGDDYIVNYILSEKRSKYTENSKLKYGIYVDGKDLGHSLKIRYLPTDTFRVAPNGISGTEFDGGSSFRWIEGGKFAGIDGRAIAIERLNGSSSPIKVGFCASLADWVPNPEVSLNAIDQNSSVLGSFTLSKEKRCFKIDLPAESKLFFLRSNVVGTFPSLFDRRKILYRVWMNQNEFFAKQNN